MGKEVKNKKTNNKRIIKTSISKDIDNEPQIPAIFFSVLLLTIIKYSIN